MKLFKEIKDLINEHGSSLILRERIALINDKMAELEEKYRATKEELSKFKIENTKLREQLNREEMLENFVECRGALFKIKPSGGYYKTVYCPSCKFPMSSFDGEFPYACDRCRITIDFSLHDIPDILKALE